MKIKVIGVIELNLMVCLTIIRGPLIMHVEEEMILVVTDVLIRGSLLKGGVQS